MISSFCFQIFFLLRYIFFFKVKVFDHCIVNILIPSFVILFFVLPHFLSSAWHGNDYSPSSFLHRLLLCFPLCSYPVLCWDIVKWRGGWVKECVLNEVQEPLSVSITPIVSFCTTTAMSAFLARLYGAIFARTCVIFIKTRHEQTPTVLK